MIHLCTRRLDLVFFMHICVLVSYFPMIGMGCAIAKVPFYFKHCILSIYLHLSQLNIYM